MRKRDDGSATVRVLISQGSGESRLRMLDRADGCAALGRLPPLDSDWYPYWPPFGVPWQAT